MRQERFPFARFFPASRRVGQVANEKERVLTPSPWLRAHLPLCGQRIAEVEHHYRKVSFLAGTEFAPEPEALSLPGPGSFGVQRQETTCK
jgi:hypothetical protein